LPHGRHAAAQIRLREDDTVRDGRTAFDRLRATLYAIILCDWKMEPMSGLEVRYHVRRAQETRAIPFILMSAKTEPQ
jgi:two-component system chemotaxis response regulator CheY